MTDLLLHAAAGALISLILMPVLTKLDKSTGFREPVWGMLVVALASLVVGIIKEVGDARFGGTPEVADVTFTWFGGLMMMFFILLTDVIRMKFIRKKLNKKEDE